MCDTRESSEKKPRFWKVVFINTLSVRVYGLL